MNSIKTGTFTIIVILTLLTAGFTHAQTNSWTTWNDTLQQAVSNEGYVNYNSIANSQSTNEILNIIAATKPNSFKTLKHELSFYINSYNALAIEGILAGGSPDSLLGRHSFFKRSKYIIAGTKQNLYDLEHDIIRQLDEPRIHFAIVCASHSCPKLRNSVYQADSLDQQLDDAAQAFINDSSKNRFDTENNVAHLSKIFKWFSEDFEKDNNTVLEYIAGYVNDKHLSLALRSGRYKIKYNDYDWSLNGQLENQTN